MGCGVRDAPDRTDGRTCLERRGTTAGSLARRPYRIPVPLASPPPSTPAGIQGALSGCGTLPKRSGRVPHPLVLNGALDVLATGTSLLAAQDAPRIRAATDVGYAPMAAAFALAGYVTFERQIDMTWR